MHHENRIVNNNFRSNSISVGSSFLQVAALIFYDSTSLFVDVFALFAFSFLWLLFSVFLMLFGVFVVLPLVFLSFIFLFLRLAMCNWPYWRLSIFLISSFFHQNILWSCLNQLQLLRCLGNRLMKQLFIKLLFPLFQLLFNTLLLLSLFKFHSF